MKKRKAFLEAHPFCQWYIQNWVLDEDTVIKQGGFFHDYENNKTHHVPRSDQIHHRKGRTGAMLLDETFWLAVCDQGHKFIHANPGVSYDIGWMVKRS